MSSTITLNRTAEGVYTTSDRRFNIIRLSSGEYAIHDYKTRESWNVWGELADVRVAIARQIED